MGNIRKAWTPSNWVSTSPFGLGEQKPNNYAELWKALYENRDELAYAWRILNQGSCDGCALGTTGMKDWTVPGVHLCNIRLRLLRLNTMPALDSRILSEVRSLQNKSGGQLRELGRLPYPMIRKKGDRGFSRVGWEEALALIAARIRDADPKRIGFYLTSRGIPNETYYVAQKAVRAMGSNNIDNAARVCHAPSTVALKAALGVGASTCSFTDWLDTDLLVFLGSNVANNQPVATKYIHYAKKNGAKVVAVNSYQEPGMERYWIPSIPESALFGTKLVDRFFLVNAGSDVAFLNGVLKHVVENAWVDESFVDAHTEGFPELAEALRAVDFEDLEGLSGASRHDMYDFARLIHESDKAVFVWSMGITQHERGVENVQAIINLALARGHVGRDGCGLMPIRGHSGVQGGAEMGAYATAFPGGQAITAKNAEALGKKWGFDVPAEPGLSAPQMIDAASQGNLDLLFSVGGNFLEVLPDPVYVKDALERVPLRVHMDIVLSSQMFLEPGETVILLPAMTRYEIPGGVTQTSTERRVVFSPEILGRRIGEARPEWEIFEDLARRVKPDRAHILMFNDTHAIREEIARVVPFYSGIQDLRKAGDQFQYGGRHLCGGWKFPTENGRARFVAVSPRQAAIPKGAFLLSTRRGKQFNSMVHEDRDALTGAGRDAVFISEMDAARLELKDGDRVLLKNDRGELKGTAFRAPVKPGNLQVHWPEGNVLLDPACRARKAGIPDYNAVVELTKIG